MKREATHDSRGRNSVQTCHLHLLFVGYLVPVSFRVMILCLSPLPRLSAGSRLVHHELLHVHLLGTVLRLPGRLSRQGVCTVRLRLGDPWGEENVDLTKPLQRACCCMLGTFRNLFLVGALIFQWETPRLKSWESAFMQHHFKQHLFFFSPTWVSATESISFIKLMRSAGPLVVSHCRSWFSASSFTLKQTVDVQFYLSALSFSHVWSIRAGCQRLQVAHETESL